MTIFKFGQFETEIDTSDFEFMEKFETKSIELYAATNKVQKEGRRSEIIKKMCELGFAYFDDLFGAGTAQLLFEGKINMRLCDGAMYALAEAIAEDQRIYNDEVKAEMSKYTGNRQQRRKKK